jgi:hypothetical protein
MGNMQYQLAYPQKLISQIDLAFDDKIEKGYDNPFPKKSV